MDRRKTSWWPGWDTTDPTKDPASSYNLIGMMARPIRFSRSGQIMTLKIMAILVTFTAVSCTFLAPVPPPLSPVS